MTYQIDRTTGTGEQPNRSPFSGHKTALVNIAFVDAEKPVVEGVATAAQAMFRSVLQKAGLDVSDGRGLWILEADPNAKSYVDLELHVGKEVEETTTEPTAE